MISPAINTSTTRCALVSKTKTTQRATTPTRFWTCRVQASKGSFNNEAMTVNVSKAVQGAVLAVALFASPVTLGSGTGPYASEGLADNVSIDFLCDASNVSDVINEIGNTEIPLLQTDIAKLQGEDVQGVEKELQAIEQETAVLAEEYENNSTDMESLSMQANGVLSELSALKSIMRQLQ